MPLTKRLATESHNFTEAEPMHFVCFMLILISHVYSVFHAFIFQGEANIAQNS